MLCNAAKKKITLKAHGPLVGETSVSSLHSFSVHLFSRQVFAETSQELGLMTGNREPAVSLALKVLQTPAREMACN